MQITREESEQRAFAIHDAAKPFAPENGQMLKFAPGDKVKYTNPAGVKFYFKVTGYHIERDFFYANGSRYFLDWDCPWFPVTEDCLEHAN